MQSFIDLFTYIVNKINSFKNISIIIYNNILKMRSYNLRNILNFKHLKQAFGLRLSRLALMVEDSC